MQLLVYKDQLPGSEYVGSKIFCNPGFRCTYTAALILKIDLYFMEFSGARKK